MFLCESMLLIIKKFRKKFEINCVILSLENASEKPIALQFNAAIQLLKVSKALSST